ncbi:MAG: integrase [Pseudomonadales bacterium]|uniref:hypothetical protein n=1 Tax=Marinobacter sp. TaxID=50741 RepID=UPI00258E7CDB|nr:hypothetical protein [Marinobacter sp.]
MVSAEIIDKYVEKEGSDPSFSGYLVADRWECVDDTEILRNADGEPKLDHNGNTQHFAFSIDISSAYEGLSVETEFTIKLMLLNHNRVIDGVLFGKENSIRNQVYHYSRLQRACKNTGIRSYAEINKQSLADFCRAVVAPEARVGTSLPLYIAYRSYITLISVLEQIQDNKAIFGLTDAPSCLIRADKCIELVKPLISTETNWKEWIKGGTLGNVPIEIALLMLQEGLGFEESIELKSLIAIVQGVSEVSIERQMPSRASISQALKAFLTGNYRRDADGVYRIYRRKRQGVLSEVAYRSPKKRGKGKHTFAIAERIFDKYEAMGGNINSMLLPSSLEEMNDQVRFALYRCSAMISILTGARRSELKSLPRDSFNIDEKGNATFVSRIRKTNHGVETERSVSIHAAHFAGIALRLNNPGIHHPDDKKRALLQVYVPWRQSPFDGTEWNRYLYGEDRAGRGSGRSLGLKGFYEKMLAALISDFDPGRYPLSSHRFRHTWAEIAIRRFDGNVPEAIRNHFRHWFGSFMTMDYLRDKVKADLPEINRQYMRELIHRAASGQEEFFGPSGRYLLSRIREIELLTPEGIDELLSEFDVLEVHEYSYCMMPKAQKTLAKCYDKATQTPQYGNAKWEHCGGCAGRLALANHKDVIQRIGMREQEVMASRAGLGLDALSSLSRKVIRQCEVALEDFEKHIPLVDITSDEEGIF